ncbi:hypothetical protein K469DRAFT_550098, partial [Zopfia rhizophila CBS 207.26]
NNNNSYILSKIRKHNVVIIILSNRKYSILTAASVTRDIVYSFLNIKVSLIVSISNSTLIKANNIYFSNIIISSFYNRNSGVF